MSAIDDFARLQTGNDSTPRNAVAVVPSDTVDLANVTRYLYVGVTGDVTVNMVDSGTSITFKAMPIGMYKLAVSRVYATGTTATNIVALR